MLRIAKNDVFNISLAFILILMIIGQLFTFEKFYLVLEGYNLDLISENSKIISIILLTVEVYSLPYLINMNLPKLINRICLFFSWTTIGFWLTICISLYSGNNTSNIGIFGSEVNFSSSLLVITTISLLIMVRFYMDIIKLKNNFSKS